MHVTRAVLKTEAKTKLSPLKKPSMVATAISWLLPNLLGASGLGALLLDGPFSQGMALYFLRLVRGEGPGVGTVFLGFSKFLRNIRTWLLQVVFILLWGLLLVAPGVIAALRYSMVWFVLADEPELTARQALDRSKALTKGRLGDLFVLALSFIGWIAFGIVTLGIGLLWVVPYVQTTWALVYEGMKAAEKDRQP